MLRTIETFFALALVAAATTLALPQQAAANVFAPQPVQLGAPAAPWCALPPGVKGRGLWVWTPAVVTDPVARGQFFAFAKPRGVRAVYLSGTTAVQNPQGLQAFVNDARAHCMEVELLFGRMEWALAGHHAEALQLAQQAVAVIQAMPGARPTGLHFDVEPYTLGQWKSDMNGTANQYLDLLEKLTAVAHGAGLRMTADVPFWFDTKTVWRAGVARPLNQWVQDRVDRVALMDYRDTAAEIVAMGATEVAYAASIGRQVVLGVETMCISPEGVTFCTEGNAAMEAALQQTVALFAGSPALVGLAVHHYGSYAKLKS